MRDTPSQSTILVHLLPPLDVEHAYDHITAIRTHDAPAARSDADELTWEIKNKYYAATVAFKLVDSVAAEGDEPAIIVLAPRSPCPPPALTALLSQYSSRDSEYEIALLVSYPLTPSAAARATDEDAWDDLALAHGFEWVDLAVGNGGIRIEDEGEDRIGEQTGVARVVAALHAHMWEGMVQAPKVIAQDAKQEPKSLNDEEDEFSALGAPPLPDPRPFVPTPMAFPSTFLPSLSKKARSPPAATLLSPLVSSPTSMSDPLEAPPFDDDFAPFVPALPRDVTSFPPLFNSPLPPPSSTTSRGPPSYPTAANTDDLPATLYRHPVLSLPDGHELPCINDDANDADESGPEAIIREEDLDELVEKLQGFKAEADGMRSMEERRAFAERVVGGLGLLGA